MIDLAIEVAALAHRGQVRKASDVPYIAHPYAVGMLLAWAGCSDEVMAAGILHDTVEDTPLTLDYLRETFGDTVASIVEGCSEPDKSASWEERKRHTLHYLPTAPWEVRTVACADKLHNIRTIAAAHKQMGEQVWTRFNKGRAEQAWYYRGLVGALCAPRDGEPPIPFCDEFKRQVEQLFGGEWQP